MTLTAKLLCAFGCILLLATAAFHGTGYSGVRDALAASSTSAFLVSALPGVWLHFSIHLVVLVAFGVLALFLAQGARSVLGLVALAVSADAALVFSFAGFFAGVALLAGAALCFAIAAAFPIPRKSMSPGSAA